MGKEQEVESLLEIYGWLVEGGYKDSAHLEDTYVSVQLKSGVKICMSVSADENYGDKISLASVCEFVPSVSLDQRLTTVNELNRKWGFVRFYVDTRGHLVADYALAPKKKLSNTEFFEVLPLFGHIVLHSVFMDKEVSALVE